MPKSHRPYPAAFRRQMIELVRRGRTPEELADEFEPSAQAIRNWVKQAGLLPGERMCLAACGAFVAHDSCPRVGGLNHNLGPSLNPPCHSAARVCAAGIPPQPKALGSGWFSELNTGCPRKLCSRS